MEDNKLGNFLKECREKTGLTLLLAARKIGVSRQHLWELENNKTDNPTLNVLLAIFITYRITPQQLVDAISPNKLQVTD